jgi:DNA-binding response OmpR family regulator
MEKPGSVQIELIAPPNILVIEDDAGLQATIETALLDEGLQPAIAASGEEAITLLRSDRSGYRALVTDIKLLGRIDGWEVARTARQLNPTLPVVYITGAGAGRWKSQGVPSSVLLEKPFDPADLVAAILRLLRNPRGGE